MYIFPDNTIKKQYSSILRFLQIQMGTISQVHSKFLTKKIDQQKFDHLIPGSFSLFKAGISFCGKATLRFSSFFRGEAWQTLVI